MNYLTCNTLENMFLTSSDRMLRFKRKITVKPHEVKKILKHFHCCFGLKVRNDIGKTQVIKITVFFPLKIQGYLWVIDPSCEFAAQPEN